MRTTGIRSTIALCAFLGLYAAAAPAAAQGASLEAATDAQKDAAQKAFLEGAKAQEKGDHEKALAGFQASYAAVASPNSHLMIARELVALGRYAEAYAEYEKTAVEAEAAAKLDKKYEQAAEAAKKEGDEVRGKIALLSVTGAKAGTPLKVRGREIPESEWSKPIPVMPGMVQVEQGGVTKEVDAQAGGSPTVDLAPAAAPTTPGETGGEGGSFKTDSSKWDTRTWAYVAGGVGAAGLVTFGVFGLLNNSKHSKLEDECQNGVCPKSLESEADTGRTYQTVANVGLVVGVVGLGAGTALYLMSGDSSEKPTAKQRSAVPRVDVGYRSITVSGSF